MKEYKKLKSFFEKEENLKLLYFYFNDFNEKEKKEFEKLFNLLPKKEYSFKDNANFRFEQNKNINMMENI